MAERLTVGVAARLSRYLQVLTQAKKMGKDRISSHEISEYTNINATQIRRDLSSFGSFGKRGVGYNIDSLLAEIRKILRTQGQHNIALVGAGRLGDAIASSPIFAEHGITIAAVFDSDPAKVGRVARRRHGQPARSRSTSSSASGTSSSASSPFPPTRRRRPRDALVGAGVKIVFNYSQALLDDPVGRAGAHVEPRRRAALRAVLPPDLAAREADASASLRGSGLGHDAAMRILLWHGYLLGGTGSNVYTRSSRASGAGPGTTSPCSPRSRSRSATTSAAPDRCGPTSAGCCPSSCSTATRATTCSAAGLHAGGARPLGRGERGRGPRRCFPPTSSSRTMSCSAARSAPRRARRSPSRRTAPSSSTRCAATPELWRWGAEALASGPRHVRRLGAHPHRPRARCAATSTACTRCRRASTSTSGCRSRAALALAALRRGGAHGPAEPGQRGGAAARRGQRRPAGALPRRRRARRRLLRQADRAEGRPRPPRRAGRDRRPHSSSSGSGPSAARSSGRRARARGRGALHRTARASPPPPPARARRRLRRPVDLPGGVRHGRRGGCRGRVPADRRAPLGARRGRGGPRGGYPPALRDLAASTTGDAATSRASLRRAAVARRRPTARRSARPPGDRSSSAGAGPASRAGCSNRSPEPPEPLRMWRIDYLSAPWARRNAFPPTSSCARRASASRRAPT